MIRIKLKDTPPSTQTIYRYNGPRMYMTKEGVDCKTTYQWEMKSQYKGKPLTRPISVVLELYFTDKRKRDVDNFNKLVLDAGSGLLWQDDSQIHELVIRKTIGERSGVELCII